MTLNQKISEMFTSILKKLQKFDVAYFRGKNYFEEDGTENCLVFQGAYKYSEDVNVLKTLLNFMLIYEYLKDHLMKKLVLLLDLNVHL